ncbi:MULTISPECIES: metal ABC transporter permease [Corallococcus]|uniref:Cation ABC transporter permease n=1 Tax=Corallococcus coralloides (strain ATCC 25202 / DSM 2259 / NBRC 100086 / M2) TaxID=1144275 RepID=H8MRE6_CORCM|nr:MULTISPECIES: metal ABC transporter permease [Corallococcus]AFE11210.1 cation ABC transporter permease [Corallococcus coralloides DSM 2259]MBN9684239.1 metal ABC transporter permease [Corallococcus sp. NCSPR001]WAS84276.1 metal ABC transporter permease [Corallococcus sp. NCRR]
METTLLEPSKWEQFQAGWELFRDPILCALIAGCVLGFLSVYVVLRRMVFVSAAVTNTAGLGVALAFFAEIHLGVHVDPLVGAVVLSVAATLLLMIEPARLRLSRESLLGCAFAFAGGAAILVGDRIAQEAHDIQGILFGTAVLVTPDQLQAVAVSGAVLMVLHLWWFRGIAFVSFDRIGATVQGLPVKLLDTVLMVSIGIMVGVCARALGALPVFAFSTLSAIAALVLDLRLPWTFFTATVLGGIAGAGGYLFAYFYDFPVGGSQTVLSGVLVLLMMLVRLIRVPFTRRA